MFSEPMSWIGSLKMHSFVFLTRCYIHIHDVTGHCKDGCAKLYAWPLLLTSSAPSVLLLMETESFLCLLCLLMDLL